MAGRNKPVTKGGVGHPPADGGLRGLAMLTVVAILTVLGIAIWLIADRDD